MAKKKSKALQGELWEAPPNLPFPIPDLLPPEMTANELLGGLNAMMQELGVDPADLEDIPKLAAQLAEEDQELAALEADLARERAALGRNFSRFRGDFWSIPETRPYMRARMDLANALSEQERLRDAADHWLAMLELNPNDNMGVRDLLLGALLELHDLRGAARLLEQFHDEGMSTFAWGRALFAWATARPADELLADARAANRHAEKYLSGAKKPPVELPELYGYGDEDEARYVSHCLRNAWAAWPQSNAWLKEQSPAGAAKAPRKKRKPS